MKKTLRWLLSALLFAFCFVFLFGYLTQILRKKTGGDSDMVHSFYEIEENTLDVLCVGSSHGFASFYPNILWKDCGLASYALCSPRQSVATSYYMLKEALQYQKPRVLLMEAYYFMFGKRYTDEATLRMSIDGMRFGPVKMELVEDLLGDYPIKQKLSVYLPFIKYHSRWPELQPEDFQTRPYLKGATFKYRQHPLEDPGVPEGEGKISKVNLEYFDKIIQLCNEHDIELVMYAAPYGYDKNYKAFVRKQKVNNALESYLAERGIPFLNYQRTNAAGIDYAVDFWDSQHLNAVGAIKTTRHLGSFLREHYELPDHRQEEAYQSWNEDYKKFQADAEIIGIAEVLNGTD